MSIATNRKARHEYHILDKYEAGVSLKGSEVKSIRDGKVSIKEAYVRFISNELYIVGMHIAEYENRGYEDIQNLRDRKLLLHKRELSKLKSKVDEKGVTMVPLSIYLKKNLIKIEFGLAKGKKLWDKRKDKMDKDIKRSIDRKMKEHKNR
jgi:SsrA-binding protein